MPKGNLKKIHIERLALKVLEHKAENDGQLVLCPRKMGKLCKKIAEENGISKNEAAELLIVVFAEAYVHTTEALKKIARDG